MLIWRVVVLLVLAGLTAVPVEGQVYLVADFEGKTIDAPIGTGGAGVGEPDYVSGAVLATVRATPMASPCLELKDNDDFSTGDVSFNLLGGAEISSGFVSFSVDLWVPSWENFYVGIREAGSSACFFMDFQLLEDGVARAWDSNGMVIIDTGYPTGRKLPLEILYNMDAGTYDIIFDGELVLDNRAHGITACGVGSIMVSVNDDVDLDGTYYVDNILVEAPVFKDGFDAGGTSEWSALSK